VTEETFFQMFAQVPSLKTGIDSSHSLRLSSGWQLRIT